VLYELALRSSNRRFEALLEKKIEGEPSQRRSSSGKDPSGWVDLSSIDFEKLATRGVTGSGFAHATKP
jgi:hypothetical protein